MTTTTHERGVVLVTGATGGQGGSAAFETLKKGLPVRAMVRSSALDSSRARALAAAGAELVAGDFSDPHRSRPR